MKFSPNLRNAKLLGIGLIAIATLILAGCGGNDSASIPSIPPTATPIASVLNDAPVKGVCYLDQPSGLHGTTDAAGTYNFNAGDSVSFWIDVSGSGCGSTAATSSSTTGISLGSITPEAPASGIGQTFVLSLDKGPQVAEALQALNHGTASSMDVSGISLASDPSIVTAINTYLETNGASQSTPTLVGTLFQGAQTAATVSGSAIIPALPISTPANFQTDVVNNLATTISSGLGAAPTTLTIPADRIVFGISSGLATTTLSGGSPTTAPFIDGHITYFDGAGNGIKLRGLNSNTFTGPLTTAELNFTYSVSGNVVSKTIALKNNSGALSGTASDATTIQYNDGKASFYSGINNKTLNNGTTVATTYSGSNIRLTPLTTSMLAGKTISFASSGCVASNGISTMTFDATGAISTNSNCGGEIATWAASDVPGILVKSSPTATGTMNDGSIVFIGLDGQSVTAGSHFVFVTENNGYAQSSSPDYPAWGRLEILSVH